VLENAKGERGFRKTDEILQSPELQARCVEEAALKRIIKRLEERLYQDSHKA